MSYDKLPINYFSKDIKKYLPKGKSKGLLYGNFGAFNMGDEAILEGELMELKNIPSTTVTVISRFPEQIKKLHKVRSISLKNVPGLIKESISSDYLIIGGGGIFCKNDSGYRGIAFQLYTILLFLYLPILLRRKIIVLGIGFYHNTNAFISLLARLGLSSAQIITVRDMASYTYLASKNLPVKLYKDNSFLLPVNSGNSQLQQGITKFYTVGIAVNSPQKLSDRDKFAKEIAEFMNTYSHSTHFVMYSLDSHPSYFSDYKFAKKIIRHVKKNVSYSYFPTSKSPQETFSSFRSTDFMITSRLHGSIFCYRLNIPFYAIAYDIKCDTFLNSIGHQYTHPSSVTRKDIAYYFDVAKMKKKERSYTPLNVTKELSL